MHFSRRLIAAFSILCSFLFAGSSFALDEKELKEYLSKNLTNHLPITVIGPLVAKDISVVKVKGGFSVDISSTQFFSGEPVGDFSFVMKELTVDLYRVEDAQLPLAITNEAGEILPISRHSLEGVWSMGDQAYRSIAYGLEGFSVEGKTSELTFSNFDLLIGEQKPDGKQEFSLDLGPLSIFDKKDKDSLVFDGLKAKGTIVSEETLKPYRVIRRMVSKVMMDGEGLLRDQSAILNLLKPLYVSYDSANIDLETGKLRIEEPEKKARYAFDSISFKSDAADLLKGTEGHSDFDFTVKGLQATTRETALTLSKLRVFAGSDKINGTHAFKYGKEYTSLLDDEEAEVDLVDAMDLYLNFNDFGMQVELADLSLATGDGTSIELGETSFGGQLQGLRSDQADLLLNVAHEELDISGIDEELFKALLPEKSRIILRLDDVPMTQVKDGLKDKKIPVSLIRGDDKALGVFMRELGFQLLNVVLSQPPQIKIEDSLVDTPSIKSKIDGTFDIAPFSSKLVAGHINVYASGFKDLQKAASKSMRSESSRTRKVALGLVGGLGIAQGFGKKQDDGSLLYKLSLDEEGIIKVNNLPLPKF